ncbi:hypothetical protein BDV98DRAFT_602975 [Pterulicium gracile]|uniref:Transmembrane protein n=1 Tax=Pterulicium gracile TaxID=1884261 RepID=A0A5C3QRU8_9AGAR|nr:hypothetical protein BDV98DRAFT_602975 [Pterula gracilis]
MARFTYILSIFSTLLLAILVCLSSGTIATAASGMSTTQGTVNDIRDYMPDFSNGLRLRSPAQKRIHAQSSPSQAQHSNLHTVIARQNPADALGMMVAAQSTLSLLEAQRTRFSDDEDAQQPTSTFPILDAPPQPTLPPTSFVDPQGELPSQLSLPLPSESAIQNFLLPFPGEDNNMLPHITAPDIVAVVTVGVVVIIILVLFFLPRKRTKPARGKVARTPKPRYIIQSPEDPRYSYPLDLEKGKEESEENQQYTSAFKFPPMPSPAHTTGHDSPPGYSSPRFS